MTEVATIVHAREFNRHGTASLYLWWGATVCQHDWLLCPVDAVQNDCVVRAYRLMHELARTSGHDQARLAKASQANSLIAVHSFIPVVV
eukprot:8292863-Alexandrium_andersonii.AAC.1